MATPKNQVLSLYRSLMRESSKFTAYNFRNYALRRVRDGFRQNKEISDPNTVNQLIVDARKNLEIIKRQVMIGQMYSTDKLVIETIQKAR